MAAPPVPGPAGPSAEIPPAPVRQAAKKFLSSGGRRPACVQGQESGSGDRLPRARARWGGGVRLDGVGT
ncbi:Imm1 family immunity protein [Streptomyces sp. NPDC059605]|uniref:Imm1 family immunity protein n=1 Tax=Streptomyces sp. NPDC059605 TaxID=3346882 RepID=UPI0036AB88F8